MKQEVGEDPRYIDVQSQLVNLIVDQLHQGNAIGDPDQVRDYAWAALEALRQDDPDYSRSGWLVVGGQLYKVVDAEQVGEDDYTRGWTVVVQRDRNEEEDPE